jgi:hypothetical protein
MASEIIHIDRARIKWVTGEPTTKPIQNRVPVIRRGDLRGRIRMISNIAHEGGSL